METSFGECSFELVGDLGYVRDTHKRLSFFHLLLFLLVLPKKKGATELRQHGGPVVKSQK